MDSEQLEIKNFGMYSLSGNNAIERLSGIIASKVQLKELDKEQVLEEINAGLTQIAASYSEALDRRVMETLLKELDQTTKTQGWTISTYWEEWMSKNMALQEYVSSNGKASPGEQRQYEMYTEEGNGMVAEMVAEISREVDLEIINRKNIGASVTKGLKRVSQHHSEVYDQAVLEEVWSEVNKICLDKMWPSVGYLGWSVEIMDSSETPPKSRKNIRTA
jgi:hypothetical protein